MKKMILLKDLKFCWI